MGSGRGPSLWCGLVFIAILFRSPTGLHTSCILGCIGLRWRPGAQRGGHRVLHGGIHSAPCLGQSGLIGRLWRGAVHHRQALLPQLHCFGHASCQGRVGRHGGKLFLPQIGKVPGQIRDFWRGIRGWRFGLFRPLTVIGVFACCHRPNTIGIAGRNENTVAPIALQR
jgi:hypothetical protein